jgi:hypothetical protein
MNSIYQIGSKHYHRVEPGESVIATIDLSICMDLSRKGIYTVVAKKDLLSFETEAYRRVGLASNAVRFELEGTPAGVWNAHLWHRQ